MNYILGSAKIPKDFTVQQLRSAITLLERVYNVKIGIAQIKELESTFFELKLKSNAEARSGMGGWSENINVIIDNNIKLFKINK